MLDGREFTLKTDHKSLIPSLMREKINDSDRQLAFLAEMTANFQYIASPLNAAADAMSRLPPAEEDADEVCAILPEDNPRHWEARIAGSPASGQANPVSSRQTGLNKTVCLAQAKGRAYAVVETAKGPKCRRLSCPFPSTSLSTSSYEGAA